MHLSPLRLIALAYVGKCCGSLSLLCHITYSSGKLPQLFHESRQKWCTKFSLLFFSRAYPTTKIATLKSGRLMYFSSPLQEIDIQVQYILVKSYNRTLFHSFLKIQPRKIFVSRFELWFRSRYPIPSLQNYGIGDNNHSTVTRFFKSSETWFSGIFFMKSYTFCK